VDYHAHFSRHLASQLTKFNEFFNLEQQYEAAQAYESPAIYDRAKELGKWEYAAVERLRITYETSNVPAGPLAVHTLMELAEYLRTHQPPATVQTSYIKPKCDDAEQAAELLWSQYRYSYSTLFASQRAEEERQQKLYEFEKQQAEQNAAWYRMKGWTFPRKLRGNAPAFEPSIVPTPPPAVVEDHPKPDNDSGYETLSGSFLSGDSSDRLSGQLLKSHKTLGQGDTAASPNPEGIAQLPDNSLVNLSIDQRESPVGPSVPQTIKTYTNSLLSRNARPDVSFNFRFLNFRSEKEF
jgi:hypothetical protein